MNNYKGLKLIRENYHFFKLIFIIYFTLLIGELIGLYIHNKEIELIFKPSLMLVLIIYYTLLVVKVNYWYLLTLLLTLIFDTINIYNNIEHFFLAGIIIAPFIDIYYTYTLAKKNKKLINSIVIVSFLFMVIGGVLIYTLSPSFNNIITPVLIKEISILVLCSMSFVNYLRKNSRRNLWLFISFILIFLADTCFGIYTYYNNTISLNIFVVLFYSISHYLSFVQITKETEFIRRLH